MIEQLRAGFSVFRILTSILNIKDDQMALCRLVDLQNFDLYFEHRGRSNGFEWARQSLQNFDLDFKR